MTPEKNHIRVVLFDLGGVLVELSGLPTMLAWMDNRLSAEELSNIWLASPIVRAFETGRTTPEVFADELIKEMALPVARDELLRELAKWPVGLFPGALELLGRVPQQYVKATLSNSNALHWPRVMNDMHLEKAFDHHFVSFLTGKIKPDAEAFQHVMHALSCPGGEILFLDDNQLNVEGARRVGMKAFQAKGVAAAEQVLAEFGVLDG